MDGGCVRTVEGSHSLASLESLFNSTREDTETSDWEEQCSSVALTGVELWAGGVNPNPRDILWDVVCPCEEEVELKVKALDLPVDPSSYATCGEFWVMILDTSLLC